LHFNRLQFITTTGNLRNLPVAHKLGFSKEGIERNGELHVRGFVDLVVFSLLLADR